jgi:hypothetical protein
MGPADPPAANGRPSDLVSALVVGSRRECIRARGRHWWVGPARTEVRTETVTQVSERLVWTPDCEKLENQFERRQCEGIMAGYNKSLQSAATTTPPAPKPTQPPAATIEQGTWAVPNEVKPGTYVSDGGEGCYWARLRDLSGGLNSIIANGGDVGRQRVTILRSDKGFETNECGVWRKVS